VHEHILAAIVRLNEAKAFLGVEKFHSAANHCRPLCLPATASADGIARGDAESYEFVGTAVTSAKTSDGGSGAKLMSAHDGFCRKLKK
jgi:hypothetical protein